MYVHSTRLPHVLSPKQYVDADWYERELQSIFRSAWHFVGTTNELAKPGDFLTTVLADTPVHIRNFSGELRALSNVCPHRHSIISSKARGNDPTMRCQYHGWEFQQDGRTGKIPEPKNFVPFDVHPCLDRYQIESVGQLVFVNLDQAAPSLRQYFGEDYYAMLDERFGDEWLVRLDWELEYAANWKIPIENSLEAYHVPAVHPKTFQVDPGDARSQHLLLDNRTSFSTTLPFAPHSRIQATLQRMDARVTKLLGHEVTNQYSQHHVFPHTMFSFTDVLSLCHAVIPTGTTTSRAVIRQFGRMPKRGRGWKLTFAKAWTAFGSTIAKRIMQEDLGMFANIQNGLRYSPHQGMLGRCEERIHSFQEYIARTVR